MPAHVPLNSGLKAIFCSLVSDVEEGVAKPPELEASEESLPTCPFTIFINSTNINTVEEIKSIKSLLIFIKK